MPEYTEQEAMAVVLAAHPNAMLVPEKTRAGTDRLQWTVRDKITQEALGATSISTPERAWIYAAMNVTQP